MFSGHCIKATCDQSCPALVESSFLLEQNNITINSDVFHANPTLLAKYNKIVENSEGKLQTVIAINTNSVAELLTYCGICKYWRGSRLHTSVYNLKLSQYLEGIQNSWSGSSNLDALEYQKIWVSKAKLLIISNIDFVNFKDFQCQTLLSLLQSRDKPDMGTIVVSPTTQSLVGSGLFFNRLHEILGRTTIK
jgi:hypothetical protein